MPIRAVFDANVLYSATLRDLFMRLAATGAVEGRWSAMIHDEWIRNVLARRPDITADALQRTRQLMDLHALDAVVTAYEPLIDTLTLPDPNDRHVLAAAIVAQAEVIVTFDTGDFPAHELGPYRLRAEHPDDFVLMLLTTYPTAVYEAVRSLRGSLIRSPKTAGQLIDMLARNGLQRAAEQLCGMEHQL